MEEADAAEDLIVVSALVETGHLGNLKKTEM